MFILKIIGPSDNAEAAGKINPARIDDKSKKPGNKENALPLQGEDSFDGMLPEARSPFEKEVDLQTVGKKLGKGAPPLSEKQEQFKALMLKRLAQEKLPDGLKEKIAQRLCENPDIDPNSSSRIKLIRTPGGDLNVRLANFLKEIGLGRNEELAELLKARLKRDNESREIEKVLTAMSASAFPQVALSSLKNILGSLKSPFAITLASSGISQLAPYATQEAIKKARETGDTSYAKAVLAALRGAVSNACVSCPDENVSMLGDISIAPNVQNHSIPSPQLEEITAVDEHTGEVLGVFYESSDECEMQGEHCNAVQQSDIVMTETTQNARSGLISAEHEAAKRTEEKKEASSGREEMLSLNHQEHNTTEPQKLNNIQSAKGDANKSIGLA